MAIHAEGYISGETLCSIEDPSVHLVIIYCCINNATYVSFIRSQITLHLFGILLDAAKR